MPHSFIVFRLTLLLILFSNLGTQVVLGSCTEEQNERALVIGQEEKADSQPAKGEQDEATRPLNRQGHGLAYTSWHT